jgi:hypothetical protein
MLPRRPVRPTPATEVSQTADAMVEILESQIAADRAGSRPTSRPDSRKILQKKKPKPQPPVHASCGISPEGVKAETQAPSLCYFDRLTQRSVFDDPLDDFPDLRRLLHQ